MSPMEFDFLGLHHHPKRPTSPKGEIQKVVSRVSPDMLRSVIASNARRSQQQQQSRGTAPLTIFYNGTVKVINATNEMAENIIKMASEGLEKQQQDQQRGLLLEEFKLNGDMPLFRKKSLQRFLEKRRERLTASGPYTASSTSSVGNVDLFDNKKPLLKKNKIISTSTTSSAV